MTKHERACSSGKKRYADQTRALNSLTHIRDNNPHRGERRAYACGKCAGWHLTSHIRDNAHPAPTQLPCPTPQRVPHRTQEAADTQRTHDLLHNDATLYPYKCRCGAWHLTPNLDQELPTYDQPRPEDVARIRHLSQTAFSDLVDADAKRTAPLADRVALRHPDNHTRWRWALKNLQREVRARLATTGTDQWRTKAEFYDAVLTDRLNECQALRTHTRAARAA